MPKRKETRGRPKTLNKVQRKKNIIASNERWRKANTKIINVRFNLEKDKDILDHIDKQPNKADYIRQLILEDMKKNN